MSNEKQELLAIIGWTTLGIGTLITFGVALGSGAFP